LSERANNFVGPAFDAVATLGEAAELFI